MQDVKKSYGRMTVVLGPMFAGKTSETNRLIDRWCQPRVDHHNPRNVLVLKHQSNNRFHPKSTTSASASSPTATSSKSSKRTTTSHTKSSSHIFTRNGIAIPFPTINIVGNHLLDKKNAELHRRLDSSSSVRLIAIDEGQFFKDIREFCNTQLRAGRDIIVAGLSGDADRRPFGDILSLIPLSSEIIPLRAICMGEACRNEASFTLRLNANNKAFMSVGDKNMYKALCYDCFPRIEQQVLNATNANKTNSKTKIETGAHRDPPHWRKVLVDAPKKDDLADSLFQALAHKYVKGTEKKVKADQALKRKARREARKRKKTKTKRKRGCGDEDDTEGGECELDAEAVEDAKRRRRLALFESNIQTKSNNN